MKRKPGRPKGSKNKPKIGRPKGSKNKQTKYSMVDYKKERLAQAIGHLNIALDNLRQMI